MRCEGAVLVDCGTAGSGAKLAGALQRLGLRPGDVRLIVLTHGNGDHASGVLYNAAGQMRRLQYGNGMETRYGYYGTDEVLNPADRFFGRLEQICVIAQNDANCPDNSASNALLNLSYWYDAVGNVRAVRGRTNDNQVQWFTYDALDRLTDAYTESQGEGDDLGKYDQSFAYDAIGNLTGLGGVSQWYSDTSDVHAVTQAWRAVIACDLIVNVLKQLSWRKGILPFRVSLSGRRCPPSGRP